jgi:hypothetical protein
MPPAIAVLVHPAAILPRSGIRAAPKDDPTSRRFVAPHESPSDWCHNVAC